MRTFNPTEAHHKFMADIKAQVPAGMPDQEILAVVAQWVGQLVALQRFPMTAEMAIQIVNTNIEIGNRTAQLSVGETEGSS